MVCLDTCILIDYINGKIDIPNNQKDFKFLDIELVDL